MGHSYNRSLTYCQAEGKERHYGIVGIARQPVSVSGGKRGRADGGVEFAEREQADVRGDGGAVEFELEWVVKGDPHSLIPKTLAVHSGIARRDHCPGRSSGKSGLIYPT